MSIDDKLKGISNINLLPEEYRPKKNRFVKGCKSFFDYYLNFSSENARKTQKEEIGKVYWSNAGGGLLAIGVAATLYPLFPFGTGAAIFLAYAGGKGLYNASRIRDKYLDEIKGIEIKKESKLYKVGQTLKKYTEGIF